VARLRQATVAEIMEVPGIGAATAAAVLEALGVGQESADPVSCDPPAEMVGDDAQQAL
jgi:excinuclease ABC subunit C